MKRERETLGGAGGKGDRKKERREKERGEKRREREEGERESEKKGDSERRLKEIQ